MHIAAHVKISKTRVRSFNCVVGKIKIKAVLLFCEEIFSSISLRFTNNSLAYNIFSWKIHEKLTKLPKYCLCFANKPSERGFGRRNHWKHFEIWNLYCVSQFFFAFIEGENSLKKVKIVVYLSISECKNLFLNAIDLFLPSCVYCLLFVAWLGYVIIICLMIH